jgi:hypothetical protein
MSKIEIQNPLNRAMFKVFLTQFIQIKFFKEEKDFKSSLDSLKNLLFPPETTDEVFNNLISFVTKLIDLLIRTEKELDDISTELNEEYTFDDNTYSDTIATVDAQKEEIISHLNKDFVSKNINKLDQMNWNTKIILQGNGDNFYEQKYCDVQFAYHNNELKIKHKNITFFKNDLSKVLKELNNIKSNLQKIKNL